MTPKRKPVVILPPEVATEGPISLDGYQQAACRTNRMKAGDLATPILGLFGEIGSLLAALKKKRREGKAYATYDAVILEELGDALWYLTTVASCAGLEIKILAQRASRPLHDEDEVRHREFSTFSDIQSGRRRARSETDVEVAMIELAARAGELVEAFRTGKLSPANDDALSGHLVATLQALIATGEAVNVDLNAAARGNLDKTFSRWPIEQRYANSDIPDTELPRNERLPRQFKIFIEEHHVNGKTYVLQKRNGVIIGDRLTDNKAEKDNYRFHDVFHFAYAVHLGWSPVLRALFRVKRKSRAELDENEDGARAIIIEEGIATFVFARALDRKLFDGLEHLDYDLLKLVQDFVRGFEAERCAAWQWERAILDGFRIFRELTGSPHRRGCVFADLDNHTLRFEPGEDTEGP